MERLLEGRQPCRAHRPPGGREWIDRLEVEAIIHQYADAVTRADWSQCAAVFAPNAVWESPQLELRFDGRDAFLDVLRQTSRASELLIHTVSSPVVRFEGLAGATATTTVHEVVRGLNVADNAGGEVGTPVNVEQYGIYRDEIERIDGRWLFVHRVFTLVYADVGRVTGEVAAVRSSLAALAQPQSL